MTFFTLSALVASVLATYVCLRCIRPLRWPLWGRLAACVAVFLCALEMQILRTLFPGAVVPELAPMWLMLGGWALMVVISWAVLSLLCDVCLLTWRLLRQLRFLAKAASTRPARPPHPARPARPPQHGLRVGLLLGMALLLSTVSIVQGVRVPPVQRVEIAVDHLPRALWGFRIVQLSDMHISPLFRQDWARAVVERANALRPDLIVLTGDMIDGSTLDRAADVAPLADLHARYGVFACVGNHEYYAGLEPWVAAFESLGVHVLMNSHALVEVRGGEGGQEEATLVLGGVTDLSGTRRKGGEDPDVAKAFGGAPAPGATPGTPSWRLLLAHQPVVAEQAAGQSVGLQLSGHTHGGQIFPVSQLVARFNSGYAAGMYAVDGMSLYVSRGVGLWGGFPLRLDSPSEITEIILRPRVADGAGPAR